MSRDFNRQGVGSALIIIQYQYKAVLILILILNIESVLNIVQSWHGVQLKVGSVRPLASVELQNGYSLAIALSPLSLNS